MHTLKRTHTLRTPGHDEMDLPMHACTLVNHFCHEKTHMRVDGRDREEEANHVRFPPSVRPIQSSRHARKGYETTRLKLIPAAPARRSCGIAVDHGWSGDLPKL